MRRAIIRFYPANSKFNRLTLLDFVSVKDRRRVAKLRCECGRTVRARFHFVLSGHTKSCSCWKRDRARKQISLNRPKVSPTLKHGGTSDPKLKPLYAVYRRMLARCQNPRADGFKHWGGRGIAVSKRWRGPNGFVTWLRDLGPRPEGYWLERVNNDGPYNRKNCRWDTPQAQRKNQRRMRGAA
jgi:hypothetical protein